jgi:hypothetical protein
MDKSAKALTAAALAVLGTQAVTTGPQPSTVDPNGPAAISTGTGLTSSDLVVGLDGTVTFDAKAHGIQFAGDDDPPKPNSGPQCS